MRHRAPLLRRIEQAAVRRRPPALHVVPGSDLGDPTIVDQAEAAGWRTTDRPSRATAAIAFDVPDDLHAWGGAERTIAIVTNERHQAWIEAGALDVADDVICRDPTTAARLDAGWGRALARVEPDPGALTRDVLARASSGPRIGIATCARSWDEARFWGDTYFARALMRALRRQGLRATELVRPDWHRPRASRCDVVVHLRGLARRRVDPSHVNVLWIISHPERVTPEECADYDIVASASRVHADRLSTAIGRQVHVLPQATDADTFRAPHRRAELVDDIVYVGNSRWPRRRAPRWMLRSGIDYRLYGRNWDTLPEARHAAESFVANRDLPELYRSAAAVIADHHGSMRTNGFVANRLFDVLASGGAVVSDHVDGIDELLGDTVPTYRDRWELAQRVDELRADPEARNRRIDAGRRRVLEHHTLDHRAAALVDLIDAHAPTGTTKLATLRGRLRA